MNEAEKLTQAIAALEAQRTTLGNEIVAAALGPLKERLATLQTTAPPAPAEKTQQRRILTVLFADISGFTAMSENMDAEDVRDTMNALWERLDHIMLAHGGRIDKHMGDGVMALWGADETREDDPEQAILAALEMQIELESFQPETQTVSTLKMRIGINTGPVLLGQIGTQGEITAMGDTVNLAARLEQACPTGAILISHNTYRHVRGVFDVEPQKPLELKGKSELVQTYLALQAKPRAFRLNTRGVEGVETAMVGRENEMERLQIIFRESLLGYRLQLVTIIGEAGIGKSRLLYEFNTWAELQIILWWWFKGRARLSMMNAPYALLRDIFTFRFEIQDGDPLETAHKKLEAGFREFLPDDPDAIQKAHVIGHLIGLDFSSSPHLQGILQNPRQIRQQALFYLVQFFQAVAQQFPVLMMLDDMQWADSGSLDALTYLFTNLPPKTPLIALAVTRPTLYEHYPAWGRDFPHHLRFELGPLTKEHSRLLVNDILRKVPDLPDAIRELVVGGAEGNPFYLEELIKMLIDARVIQPDEEAWKVDLSRLATVQVPQTLTEVLQARLDSLSIPERVVIQRAALIGRIFWDTAVASIAEEMSPSEIETTLENLKHKELIFECRPATFYQTREYTFKHTLLQEVTYNTLLKRQRLSYHAAIATWLNQTSGERRAEYLPNIAEHYEKSGDYAHAAATLSEAADRALRLSALDEARSFFQRALTLLQHPDQPVREAIAMEIGLAETLMQMGNYPQAQKHAETAAANAGNMQMDEMVAEALVQLGQLASYQGNYQDAHAYLIGALYLARKDNTQATLGRVLVTLSGVEWRLGNLQAAQETCAEALQITAHNGDTNTRIQALNRMGMVAGALNRPEEEEQYYQQSLSLAQAVGNRERMATALNNLGAQAGEQKQWQKSLDYYQRALAISRETGAQQGTALHLINLGQAAMHLGRLQEAEECLREGLSLAAHLGAAPVVVSAALYCAMLAHVHGQVERALTLLGAAQTSPAFDSESEREVAQFLEQNGLNTPQALAIMQRGKQLGFESVVAELLAQVTPV